MIIFGAGSGETGGTGEASGVGASVAGGAGEVENHSPPVGQQEVGLKVGGRLELMVLAADDPIGVKREALLEEEDMETRFEEDDVFEPGNESILDITTEEDSANAETDLSRKRAPPSSTPIVLGRSYGTVRAARRAASCGRPLNPSPVTVELVDTGSFITDGDERILHCNLEHNLKDRLNKTLSFDPQRCWCNTCPGGGHNALAGREGGPVVIVAADQTFPACLPSGSGGKECVRVIRVEDGSLLEIAHALADAIKGHKLISGTIILLGSLSYLANVGTAQYITDWVRSRWWLKERFGSDTLVMPLAPVPVGGLCGCSTVRALVETLTWFSSLSTTEAVLMKGTHSLFMHKFLGRTGGRGWANGRQSMRVPANLDTKAFVSLVSEGWGCLPDGIPPLPPAAEKELILPMLTCLNDAFGLNLDLELNFARGLKDIRTGAKLSNSKLHVAVVGGSNADRLAEALIKDGLTELGRARMAANERSCGGSGGQVGGTGSKS